VSRKAYPIFEVKCYGIVVIEFTPSHNDAAAAYERSPASQKTLVRLDPNGQRHVLQSKKQC